MKTVTFLALIAATGLSGAAETVDYKNVVLPIMKEHCWKCHSNEHEVKGSLALDDLDEMRDFQVGPFNIIRPGKPEESSFLEKMLLPEGHTDFMPQKGDPVPREQLDLIEKWIAGGAVVDAENPSDKEKAFLQGQPAAGADEDIAAFHSWISGEGIKIEARFQRAVDNAVILEMKDGKTYQVPLDNLSAESKALAQRLAARTR